MDVSSLKRMLDHYPDDLNVRFIKHPSMKPLSFWHVHEWFVCKQTYRENGPKNEEFLAILVEDED